MKARSPRPAGKTAPGPVGDRGSGAPVRAPATQAMGPAFAVPGVQRKLAVGKSDSPFEHEADRVADSVEAGSAAPAISPLPAGGLGPAAQRVDLSGEDEEDPAQAMAEDEDTEADTQPAQMTADLAEPEEVAQPKTDAVVQDPEEPAQMVAQETEDAPVQRMAGDAQDTQEDPAQMKAAAPEEEVEDTAQAKTAGKAARDPAATEAAIRNPGAGQALPGDVRTRIERSTGADLSDVRVHDDGTAGRAARGIGARAFTHGRDIWLGPGESARDTRLMAHEAAHVVQQTGRNAATGRGPLAAPSAPAPSGAGPAAAVQRSTAISPGVSKIGASELDVNAGTMKIPEIDLPDLPGKRNIGTNLDLTKTKGRANDQGLIWTRDVPVDPTGPGVRAATPDNMAIPVPSGSAPAAGNTVPVGNGASVNNVIWALQQGTTKKIVTGTRETIAANSKIPTWHDAPAGASFSVDHIKELQLGGANDVGNLQLLRSSVNRRSGTRIGSEIATRIKSETRKHLDANPAVDGQPDPFASLRAIRTNSFSIRDKLKITFGKVSDTPLALGTNQTAHAWQASDITGAKHLEALTPTKNIANLLGTSTQLSVIPGFAGGITQKVPINPDGEIQFQGPKPVAFGIIGIRLQDLDYPSGGASLTAKLSYFNAIKDNIEPVEDSFTMQPLGSGGAPYYTFLLPPTFAQSFQGKRIALFGASRVTIDRAGITGGAFGITGTVDLSSLLFKPGTTADLSIRGEEIMLSKSFDIGAFNVPGPIDITSSSLTIGMGARAGKPNVELSGGIEFEARRIGKGTLTGKAGTQTGVAAEGTFDFDPALFKGADAQIKVGYADDKFTGEGTIKIGDGQITGIKSAELTVKVENELWEATGTVEPKIPGVDKGSLAMKFNPEGGFEITGELQLGAGIPRLKRGKLDAKLEKKDETYKVKASGEAELDIPGVAATLTASYDDGKFKALATVGYARGIASGQLTLGASNLPTDPETGQLTDGAPLDTITIFGAGQVTIRFTPWLQGTAGLKINPDGSMEVKGRVELPDTLEVFPQKKLEKELVSIGVDIPVFGVAAAGQRIGIFLNISGALTAKAAVGPGKLENVAVEVTYNPEDESSARVTGSARFAVPAEAGLRLAIQGAIGAGIPIVSARAGLEVGGALGVTGEASAAAQVEWTPTSGLSMEADIGISATPQFTFDLTGFVDVTADLVLTEIELYSKRWQLASFQYGSGMQVGASLKVKVENSEVKPISMDDITLTTPDIDPVALARGLIGKVV